MTIVVVEGVIDVGIVDFAPAVAAVAAVVAVGVIVVTGAVFV